jgi:hypothetical protein
MNHKARQHTHAVPQIRRIQHLPKQNQAFDGLSNADSYLRNQDQAGAILFLDKLLEMAFHGVDVVTHQHPSLCQSLKRYGPFHPSVPNTRCVSLESEVSAGVRKPQFRFKPVAATIWHRVVLGPPTSTSKITSEPIVSE